VRQESDIPPEPTCLRHSDAASAFKGGEAVPAGDWSEAETLERIASEVAILFHGSGEESFLFPYSISFFLLQAQAGLWGNAKRCPQSALRKLQVSYTYTNTGKGYRFIPQICQKGYRFITPGGIPFHH
jgi:hypothetical protein